MPRGSPFPAQRARAASRPLPTRATPLAPRSAPHSPARPRERASGASCPIPRSSDGRRRPRLLDCALPTSRARAPRPANPRDRSCDQHASDSSCSCSAAPGRAVLGPGRARSPTARRARGRGLRASGPERLQPHRRGPRRTAADPRLPAAAALRAAAARRLRTAYGGDSPRPAAFDCSGLVRYVFGHFGLDLPHSSYADYGLGDAASRAARSAPGDLVFFDGLGHVGLYVGSRPLHPRAALRDDRADHEPERPVVPVALRRARAASSTRSGRPRRAASSARAGRAVRQAGRVARPVGRREVAARRGCRPAARRSARSFQRIALPEPHRPVDAGRRERAPVGAEGDGLERSRRRPSEARPSGGGCRRPRAAPSRRAGAGERPPVGAEGDGGQSSRRCPVRSRVRQRVAELPSVRTSQSRTVPSLAGGGERAPVRAERDAEHADAFAGP